MILLDNPTIAIYRERIYTQFKIPKISWLSIRNMCKPDSDIHTEICLKHAYSKIRSNRILPDSINLETSYYYYDCKFTIGISETLNIERSYHFRNQLLLSRAQVYNRYEFRNQLLLLRAQVYNRYEFRNQLLLLRPQVYNRYETAMYVSW